MKGVQCYELFGGIAPKIHTFSFSLLIGDSNIMYVSAILSIPNRRIVSPKKLHFDSNC